jgi:hypothetical protein
VDEKVFSASCKLSVTNLLVAQRPAKYEYRINTLKPMDLA